MMLQSVSVPGDWPRTIRCHCRQSVEDARTRKSDGVGWQRTSRALVSAAEQWPGKKILVVTHGGVIKTLIYRLSGREFLATEPPLFQGRQLHWLVHEEGDLRIEKINALELE